MNITRIARDFSAHPVSAFVGIGGMTMISRLQDFPHGRYLVITSTPDGGRSTHARAVYASDSLPDATRIADRYGYLTAHGWVSAEIIDRPWYVLMEYFFRRHDGSIPAPSVALRRQRGARLAWRDAAQTIAWRARHVHGKWHDRP